VKKTKEFFGRVIVEYYGFPQFTLEFSVIEDIGVSTSTYGVQIDKFNFYEPTVVKSESSDNIALSRGDAENIIKAWIDELF